LRQRFTRVLGGVALFALVAAGAAACKKDNTTGGESCDLKIGFFGALSGDNAGLVTPMKNGAALALDQYSKTNPTCKVSLAEYDSQGSPDKAGGLATSAVNDAKVVGIIGPAFSGESEVANPIFDSAGLPGITPSATRPSLSTKGWKIFHRGVGNDLSQGPAAGRYIKDVLKPEKVFVVDDQSAYGAGLADEVKKTLGASVVGSDKAAEKMTEFGSIISKVKTSGATVLFYGGYTAEAAPFAKQLRAQGWTGQFVGGDGINDDNMIKVAGADSAGVLATCPCAPATAAKGTFVADYKAKYAGADPGVYADVAYDLMNVYLDAIKAGKKTRADIQAFLGSYNKAGSASGVSYKWESNGELDPSQVVVWMFVVKDGKWAPVGKA
jgi:branched-chain amino acid transport system substrate-binding protein